VVNKKFFLDIQLDIRNIRHIYDSFEEYQKEELLQNENQYYCENCKNKQNAIKGIN
jgi:ubiquitin C-terminal hydrolase